MLNLTVDEDGEESYHLENQDLLFIASKDDYVVKGHGDNKDLLTIAVNTLLFLYDTITSNIECEYSMFEYINDIITNISFDTINNGQAILKCSNANDLIKASNLAVEIDKEFKDKLPDCTFIGLDYDELKNQLGEDDEKIN